MSTESRLQAIETGMLRLTAQVAELKSSTVPMTELMKLNTAVTELKAYAKIAGGASIALIGILGSLLAYVLIR